MSHRPSPLRLAIRWSEIHKVRTILDRAGSGSADVINKDFSQDCLMNSCTRSIGNAFYYAVCKNRVQIVQVLLDHGGDIYSTGRYGETCLHTAVRHNFLDTAILLVSRGLAVQTTDDSGRHPLHAAAMTDFDTSACIRFLLDEAGSKQDVNLRDFHERSPLHEAAYHGNEAVVVTLLRYGADVTVADKYGNTPLHEAGSRGRSGVARLLLNAGAPDVLNDKGVTAKRLLS